MIADLTFWQMFGTFFIAIGVGVLVAGILVVIGSRSAKAYERAMVSDAERFRGFSNKLRKKKRSSYQERIRRLREKASGARKVQLVGLYGGVLYLAFHLARAGVGISGVHGSLRWIVVVAVPLIAVGAAAAIERRGAKNRASRLDAATDLEDGQEVTA